MKNVIKLVTKDHFYKSLGGNFPIEFTKHEKKFIPSKFLEILDAMHSEDFIMPYFKVNDYFFVFIKSLNLYLIPNLYKDHEKILEEIEKSDVDLSNWVVKRVSDKIPYIKNTYLRGDHNSLNNLFESGSYTIDNTDTNEQFQFSIYNSTSYFTRSYIGFDEMAYDDDLIRSSDKFKIEQLYELILCNNGKSYSKESDSESE